MERTDCVVAGAGVIGLAVARELALSGLEVVILESSGAPGLEASSRTGEVVHAGIHYAPDSQRARLCVEGKDLLYDYCEAKEIGHRMTGELVIATEESQIKDLEKLADQALANGVRDVRMLYREEAFNMESGLTCAGALYSPTTGIVDSHTLMKALLADAVGSGAVLVLNTPVSSGRMTSSGLAIAYGGSEPGTISCQSFLNCTGIHAQSVAASMDDLDPRYIPPSFLCRGSYFTTSMAAPASRLIYSMPSAAGPGIHMSLDSAGQARFGPDNQWMEKVDYDVDISRAGIFEQGIRRYWPQLPDGALQPGFAGFFARTFGPDEAARDWMIQGPEEHEVPGLVNLFGIDSPGLTACLAIGGMVKGLLSADS